MNLATVQCRFEDRLAGHALVLHDAQACITASAAAELDDAFARIQAAQAQGYWVALLLDYELAWWLDAGLARVNPPPMAQPKPVWPTAHLHPG